MHWKDIFLESLEQNRAYDDSFDPREEKKQVMRAMEHETCPSKLVGFTQGKMSQNNLYWRK